MKDFLSDYIHSLALLLAFSVIVFFIGHSLYLLFSGHKRGTYQSFYMKLATGLVASVMLYAIYRTCFLTMYTGVIVSLIYFHLNKKKSYLESFQSKFKVIEIVPFASYMASLSVVCLGVVFLYHFDNRLFVHSDLAFFASLGASLHEFGIEYLNTDPIMVGDASASIYHYFNEWCVALLMSFSNFTSLKILLILVFPLLTAVIIAGALSLTNEIIPKASIVIKVLISWTFVLIPGLLSFLVHFITSFSFSTPYSIVQSGIVMMKVKIVVILLLLFFNDFKTCARENNFFFLSLIPLFWNTIIPAFLGSYCLFFIYNYFNKIKLSFKMMVQLLLPIAFIPVYVFIFNLIHSGKLTNVVDVNEFGIKDYLIITYSDLGYLLSTILLYVLPITVIFIIIVIYFKKSILVLNSKITIIHADYQNTILIFLFLCLAAILSFGILRSLFDARQILMNLFYPVINIITFLGFVYAIRNKPRLTVPVLTAGYAFVLFHALMFRSGTLKELKEFSKFEVFNVQEKTLIASETSRKFVAMSLYRKPYSHLLMLNENYKPIRLDVFFNTSDMSPKDKMEYYLNVKNQSYYRYVKLNNLPPDSAITKISFIKQFKIKYILSDSGLYKDKTSYINRIPLEKVESFNSGPFLFKLKEPQ